MEIRLDFFLFLGIALFTLLLTGYYCYKAGYHRGWCHGWEVGWDMAIDDIEDMEHAAEKLLGEENGA